MRGDPSYSVTWAAALGWSPPELYLPDPLERTLGPDFILFIFAYQILNLLGAQSDWLNGFGWGSSREFGKKTPGKPS